MASKKKTFIQDEIDILDFISIILTNKYKILLISFLPTALLYFYLISQDTVKPSFKASTQIVPVTTFEELKYKNFNSYLDFYKNYRVRLSENNNNIVDGEYVYNNLVMNDFIDYSSFRKINKDYLLELFLEKINENKFKIDAIKKFELVKKENYKSIQQYNQAILKAATNLRISSEAKIGDSQAPNFQWFVQYNTVDRDSYMDFLNFYEKSVNLEIQRYLKNNFDESIYNQKIFQKYKLEDIDIDIEIRSTNMKKNQIYVEQLKKYKQNIKENQSLNRLEFSFNSTPVTKPNEFHASKLIIKSTDFTNISRPETNIYTKVIFTMLSFAVLAIFYIIISKKIRTK